MRPSATCSSAELEIERVPSADVDRRWPELWPQIERALARMPGRPFLGEYDVLERARSATWDVWTVVTRGERELLFVLTTELAHYPLQTVLRVLNCGGHGMTFPRARAILDRIERFARTMGAARVEIVGRRGWGRIFPEYRERARIFSKELC